MGNAQTTIQTIDQIVVNHTEAEAIAKASASCSVTYEIDMEGAKITNCSGFESMQECKSRSEASIDVMMKALLQADLSKESEQHVEGLALAMNIDTNVQNTREQVLNALKAKCESLSEAELKGIYKVNFKGVETDCGGLPLPVPQPVQYGDATADCVVKQIVDTQQKTTVKSKSKQTNIGFKLSDLAAPCMGIMLVFLAWPMIKEQLSGQKKNANRGANRGANQGANRRNNALS